MKFIFIKKALYISGVFLLPLALSAQSPNNFYSPTPTVRNFTLNVNANDNGGNDTSALQNLINRASGLSNGNRKGANIMIPRGRYFFSTIIMKSNVHLKVNSGAEIFLRGNNNPTVNLFRFGNDNSARVVNASIESTGGKFTINLRRTSNRWIIPINMGNVFNFKLSGFRILDKRSRFQGVNFSAARKRGGGFARPEKGFVDNINIINADYGYGLIQMHAGKNIFFRNIDGLGGTTLRLESGFREETNLVLDNIVARNIRCTNGNSAVTLSPHTSLHKRVDIRNITANNCGFGIRIEDSFGPNDNRRRGRFASNSIIRDLKVTLGNNARVKRSHFRYTPCNFRGIYRKDQNNNLPSNDTQAYRGPSISASLIDASYSVNFNPNSHISRLTQDGRTRPNRGRVIRGNINCGRKTLTESLVPIADSDPYKIDIFNLSGQKVKSTNVKNTDEENNEVGYLPKGIYIIGSKKGYKKVYSN